MKLGETICILVLVLLGIGFVTYVLFYHIRARRLGIPPPDMLPFRFNLPFVGRHNDLEAGNSFFGRNRNKKGRFAALDVDENWDSHLENDFDKDAFDSGRRNRASRNRSQGNSFERSFGQLNGSKDSPKNTYTEIIENPFVSEEERKEKNRSK